MSIYTQDSLSRAYAYKQKNKITL